MHSWNAIVWYSVPCSLSESQERKILLHNEQEPLERTKLILWEKKGCLWNVDSGWFCFHNHNPCRELQTDNSTFKWTQYQKPHYLGKKKARSSISFKWWLIKSSSFETCFYWLCHAISFNSTFVWKNIFLKIAAGCLVSIKHVHSTKLDGFDEHFRVFVCRHPHVNEEILWGLSPIKSLIFVRITNSVSKNHHRLDVNVCIAVNSDCCGRVLSELNEMQLLCMWSMTTPGIKAFQSKGLFMQKVCREIVWIFFYFSNKKSVGIWYRNTVWV